MRAVLLGLFAGLVGLVGLVGLGALASCDNRADAPAAIGTAAGKVVEVTGEAVATRAGQPPRALVPGSDVFADDVIETAADGAIEVELFHNTARWSLQSAKRVRVDQSLAWGLTKQQASAAIEHTTAAAGRNAERTAASTAATADNAAMAEPAAEPPREDQDLDSESAPRAAAAPRSPSATTTGKGASAPRRERRESARDDSRKSELVDAPAPARRFGEVGGGAPPSPSPSSPPPPSPPSPPPPPKLRAKDGSPLQALLEQHRGALERCLDPAAPRLTIVVRLAKGRPTFELTGDGKRTDGVRACVAAVVNKIAFPALDAQGSIELSIELSK